MSALFLRVLLNVALWALLLTVDAWFIQQTVDHPITDMHWPQLGAQWAAASMIAMALTHWLVPKRRTSSATWMVFAFAFAAGAQWGYALGGIGLMVCAAVVGALWLIRVANSVVAGATMLVAWLSLAIIGESRQADPADSRHPDIVLITIDTVREDALSSSPRALIGGLTPHLDERAAEGCQVDQATATSPLTGPSHAAMLSGLHPIDLGLFQNGRILDASIPWLPESLQLAGYATGGFVSSAMLHRSLGYRRGFDVYDDDQSGHAAVLNSALAPLAPKPEISKRAAFWRPGTDTVDRMHQWLETISPTQPVFVWLHLYDAHRPYTSTLNSQRFVSDAIVDLPPPEAFTQWSGSKAEQRAIHSNAEEKTTFTRELFADLARAANLRPLEDKPNRLALEYLAGVRDLDAIVGTAWDGLLQRRSHRPRVWAIVADHGESLTEHAELGSHQHNVYEANVRVPYLMSAKRCPVGPISTATVGTELLRLANIGLAWDSTDAVEAVVRAGKKADRYPSTVKVSKRIGDDKAILGYRGHRLQFTEHYDLAIDPHEQHAEATFPRQFSDFRLSIHDRLEANKSAVTEDEAVNEALRSLGYIE